MQKEMNELCTRVPPSLLFSLLLLPYFNTFNILPLSYAIPLGAFKYVFGVVIIHDCCLKYFFIYKYIKMIFFILKNYFRDQHIKTI